MTQDLLIETDGHIRLLTLNRPQARNAMSHALRADLTVAFQDAGQDPEVRAILLTGSGDKAFCAGADLKETPPPDAPPAELTRLIRSALHLFETVGTTPKPVIAALNGPALGGGLELALACDIRLAAEGARLGLPEAKVGMGAAYGSVVLPQMLPQAIAYEMMYTGRPMEAAEAARWGLVNRVLPPGDLHRAALDMAREITANAPLTTQRMKAMSRAAHNLPLATALHLDAGPNPYLSADRLEGAAAFREKRAPRWTGR